jgi:flagellar assembly protein FliH
VDQSRLDGSPRAVPLSVGSRAHAASSAAAPPALRPVRFSPPKLNVLDEQLAARNAPDPSALAAAREEGRREAEAVLAAQVAAHRQATEHMQRATSVFANALDQIEHIDLGTLHDFQQQVVSLAVQLAEEIVGRELRACDDLVLAAVERSLSLVPDRGDVVLRVHPDDLAVVLDATGSMGHRGGDVQIVPDAAVSRGGCAATCGALQVDAQLPAAFARLRDAFAS